MCEAARKLGEAIEVGQKTVEDTHPVLVGLRRKTEKCDTLTYEKARAQLAIAGAGAVPVEKPRRKKRTSRLWRWLLLED